MNKLRIVCSYIAYPLSMATYFVRALKRRDDVELIRIAPFTGNWIPWSKPGATQPGMFLPQKYVDTPEIPLPQTMIGYHIHPQMLADKLPKDIDLFLQIDAGWHFSSRPPGKVVALIETDPHVLKPTYALPKSYSDFTFCMQNNYREDDEIYLAYAYDPTVHYPIKTLYPHEKKYDVCLIGLLYEHRAKLIDKLRADGLNVYYNIGEIFDEYRERYNESKIALSWSSLKDLPARVWEGMAMGLPVVTDHVPDLDILFEEDVDYASFDTIEEAEFKVLRLMKDESLRKWMGENALKAVQSETYDKRIQTVLETVGLI